MCSSCVILTADRGVPTLCARCLLYPRQVIPRRTYGSPLSPLPLARLSKKARRLHNHRHTLSERYGFICHYCSCRVQCPTCVHGTTIPATLDHVLPKSKGGSNGLHNLVLACERCNNLKADSVPEGLEPRTRCREGRLAPEGVALWDRFAV